MAKPTVGLVGASGETGRSIIRALIKDGGFNIIALSRAASLNKKSNLALKDNGVELRALDISESSEATLVTALKGIDILISAVGQGAQLEQIPLATAAKTAGIKRFLPCAFISVIPPGIQDLRDEKEIVYNHVKRIGLPYTILDVGWWWQNSFPNLPSGKIDYAVPSPGLPLNGDGNVKSALIDLRDVGRYVALVIRDDRTLNRMVMVYNELWTQNEIWAKMEKMSGEKIPKKYISLKELEDIIAGEKEASKADPGNFFKAVAPSISQYRVSWGIRGDNTPEYAKYLGYLTSKELYPDFQGIRFEDYLQEVLDGKAETIYAELFAQMKAAQQG